MRRAGQAVPDDLGQEVQALAEPLAEVVQLAAKPAIFPGRWAEVAEMAMEHNGVRRAQQLLSVEQVIAGIENLRELIPRGAPCRPGEASEAPTGEVPDLRG